MKTLKKRSSSSIEVDARNISLSMQRLAQGKWTLDDIKKQYCVAVFYKTGSITQTAKVLDITTNTVYHLLGRKVACYGKRTNHL